MNLYFLHAALAKGKRQERPSRNHHLNPSNLHHQALQQFQPPPSDPGDPEGGRFEMTGLLTKHR